MLVKGSRTFSLATMDWVNKGFEVVELKVDVEVVGAADKEVPKEESEEIEDLEVAPAGMSK